MKNSIFILFLLTTTFFAQDKLGKIYSVEDANSKFGTVLDSKTISTSDFQDAISLAGDVFLFTLNDGEIKLSTTERKSMLSGVAVDSDEVLYAAKVEVGLQLIRLGKSEKTIIEKRANVVTITNGDYTLEYVNPCPPFCPED